MKVLFVSAEAAPLAKVGGLGDIAGALPRELVQSGHDIRLVIPSYPLIENDPKYHLETILRSFDVPLDGSVHKAYVNKTEVGGVTVYLVGSKKYFRKSVDSQHIYVPGAKPYIFFTRAVVELVRQLSGEWRPDVIHCNDWHTAGACIFLRTILANDPDLAGIATVFTIHNLSYHGESDKSVLGFAGLPEGLYSPDGLKQGRKVNIMKGGITYADLVNTVSETYAREIQTKEFGCGLNALLSRTYEEGRLRGILNGLDYCMFDPLTDQHIKYNYAPGDLENKQRNKAVLQNELGLPASPDTPIFGLVSRLVVQKGLDILRAIMPRFLDMDVQFVLLGNGDKPYETYFANLQKRNRNKVHANIGFDIGLAQRIYAGSDMFLMPSRFERSGLGQMIALRYGSVPVVRATGGLADTIQEFNPAKLSGNGFLFTGYKPASLFSAIKRAISIYQSPDLWGSLVTNGAACDFSCGSAAAEYLNYYRDAVDRVRGGVPA